MKKDDYVLGTRDDELTRLGVQHAVWRPRATDAWRRAGFTRGNRIIDVGSGPGWATLDLCDVVGAEGAVHSLERSENFIAALQTTLEQRGITNVEVARVDLDVDDIPFSSADGAWIRWVLCFVSNPREVLRKVVGSMRPGARIVIHEYFDYSTWRFAPPCAELEEFVATVMKSWRDNQGEPDIALYLPRWLEELGLEVETTNPIVDVVTADSFVWQWPMPFLRSHLGRLVELGYFTRERADEIRDAVAKAEAQSGTRLITPAVLEIIARV